MAYLDADDVRKKLDEYEDRIEKVRTVTMDSENDIVTADNKTLMDIKGQMMSVDQTLEQNIAVLASRQKKLTEQRKKALLSEQKMRAAEVDYFDSLSVEDSTFQQMAYTEAQSAQSAASGYLETAYNSPILTFIGVGNVVFNIVVMKFSSGAIANAAMKLRQDNGKLVGSLFAGLNITGTLKASGVENEYVGRIQGYYAKTICLEQKLGQQQQVLNAIPAVADEIANVLVMMIGGVLVIRGHMTAGMLVAYTSLLESFTAPVNQLVGFIQKIQTVKADMSRVEDIMKYGEDEKFSVCEQIHMNTKLSGEMELRDISFGYSILDAPIVDHFHFHLDSGSSIAFVGASGCGKSTVSKIVSGLYQPWGGAFLLDGIPARKIPGKIMASSISTVSQNITLFSGSIRDNLTMWNRNIVDEDIVKAAKDACIHDTITSKPGAYEFLLTEGGSNLSGGQRQRLEIARALVTNPSILIMDEATSALDPIVEKEIIDNIKRRGCTCIIVAHRLSAIRDCDEIIVMSRGKIVQRGTHEELAAIEGHYQRLIRNL